MEQNMLLLAPSYPIETNYSFKQMSARALEVSIVRKDSIAMCSQEAQHKGRLAY